jgi:ATP-dependent helicase HrpB
MPELELPELRSEDQLALLEQLCLGAFTYNQIKDRLVGRTFRSWLSPQQQSWLDEYAPERLALPGGRNRKLRYSEAGDPPVIAARIQDLYGVEGGLFVASRRVPVTIEVLAPNMRPIQITRDLANFWKESYPKIKQELQRKYPKHEWR